MNVTPFENLRFHVQSETHRKKVYLVDLLSGECSCIDFGVRKRECKHLRCAKLYFAEEILNDIRKKTKA